MSLRLYQPYTDEELIITRWWARLRESEELPLILSRSFHNLSKFLELFSKSATLLYAVDGEGEMEFACWLEPAFEGAFLSLWVHPSLRGHVGALKTLPLALHAHDIAFGTWPVVMAVTRSPKVVALMERFGYTIAMQIPHLFNGEPATVGWLSKEQFDGGR